MLMFDHMFLELAFLHAESVSDGCLHVAMI